MLKKQETNKKIKIHFDERKKDVIKTIYRFHKRTRIDKKSKLTKKN